MSHKDMQHAIHFNPDALVVAIIAYARQRMRNSASSNHLTPLACLRSFSFDIKILQLTLAPFITYRYARLSIGNTKSQIGAHGREGSLISRRPTTR